MPTKTISPLAFTAVAAAFWALPPSAAADDRTPLLAQACAGCHGQNGTGMGRVPRISGYDRDDFVLVWEQFREGERTATIMGRIARGYTADEIAVLADYFSQKR
jgi:sulfide dehydrogenase cytochrome subunit